MRKVVSMVLITVLILGFSIFAANLQISVNSSVEEKTSYSKLETPTETFHLPVISIQIDGKQIEKENPIWSTISMFYPEKVSREYNDQNFMTPGTIKYRGNSSYTIFDKRQYRINFYKKLESTNKKAYSLCGMGEDSDWVLNGPFLDRTLIRNHLLYSLSKEIMDWAPDSRFCELYIDGEYQGVYLAVEPIENGENRLRLSTYGLSSGQTAFILKRERVGTEENVLHTFGEINGFTSYELSVQYPSVSNLTSMQNQWIENYISSFEKSLYGEQFADLDIGYEKYINVDSFVDYFLINEIAMNADAGTLSTYCYQELGGKMYMAVWDFNNAYNNYPWEDKEFDQFFMTESPWFGRLLQDRAFIEKVKKRYKELRQGILSNENVLERIDQDIRNLGDAIDRNYEVWGYTFNEKLLSSAADGSLRDPRSYEEAITQLKEAVEKRFLFLDENLEQLYNHCIN